jgi:hypothetical protein
MNDGNVVAPCRSSDTARRSLLRVKPCLPSRADATSSLPRTGHFERGIRTLPLEWLIYLGGFNRSGQHLLNFLDEEVGHGDVTDSVHGETED